VSKSTPGGYRMNASRTAQEILTKSARKWKEEEVCIHTPVEFNNFLLFAYFLVDSRSPT
jgi:hypothetical protein